MNGKTFLITALFGLTSVGIASAKSYGFTLSEPAKAGTVDLKAGEYKVRLEGTQAIFTDVDSRQSWTTPVKVDNASKKFGQTAVEYSTQGGVDRINAIDLGGSTTKLDFGQ